MITRMYLTVPYLFAFGGLAWCAAYPVYTWMRDRSSSRKGDR